MITDQGWRYMSNKRSKSPEVACFQLKKCQQTWDQHKRLEHEDRRSRLKGGALTEQRITLRSGLQSSDSRRVRCYPECCNVIRKEIIKKYHDI